ncbi:MAG: methyltransferase domain-containing protein, partial [Arenicellales bacterium]
MTHRDHDSLVRRQFGASAPNYRTSPSHARGRSLARLVELAVPRPDWLVLDVATGAGHTAATLAPHVRTVIAGDMTGEMLAQAGMVSREKGLGNVLLVRESAQALSYRDHVFDLVACRIAAHHFP